MSESMRIAVILPAAGRGRRFETASGKTSKLEADLAGRAVLLRAIELFANRPSIAQTLIAVDPDDLDRFRLRWGDQLGFLGVSIVAGGRAERWETVLRALETVQEDVTHVAVHDAARPVADAAMIDRVLEAAATHPAVIPALPARETVKRVEPQPLAETAEPADPLDAILGSAGKPHIEAHRVIETVPRRDLWLVQTPQVFEIGLLRRAYERIDAGAADPTAPNADITDDAALVEQLGELVIAVPGDPFNIKITLPADLAFAEAVLAMRSGRSAGDALGPKRRFPTWAESEED